MIVFIVLLWLGLSIFAIWIDYYRWDGVYKVFIGASILSFILFGRFAYDPSAITGTAVTIELNPTWDMAVLLSLAGGACITGPIAAIHAFLDWLYYDRQININPFNKTSDYKKDTRKKLLEKEKNTKEKKRQSDSSKKYAKKLCRTVDILEIRQIAYEHANQVHNYTTGTFSIKNRGKKPVTDVTINKSLNLEEPDKLCIISISLGNTVINPGETVNVTGRNEYQQWNYNHKNKSEYTYRYALNNEKQLHFKIDTISREAFLIE